MSTTSQLLAELVIECRRIADALVPMDSNIYEPMQNWKKWPSYEETMKEQRRLSVSVYSGNETDFVTKTPPDRSVSHTIDP